MTPPVVVDAVVGEVGTERDAKGHVVGFVSLDEDAEPGQKRRGGHEFGNGGPSSLLLLLAQSALDRRHCLPPGSVIEVTLGAWPLQRPGPLPATSNQRFAALHYGDVGESTSL